MNLPFAESAEQNKAVIFEAIKACLKGDVLEIGSGTGQHAVFFSSQLPEIVWQTSDLPANLPGINARIKASGLQNLAAPIELDVLGNWPDRLYDFIYTANSFHIMNKTMVANCIEGVGRCLKPGGVFAVYGPFNYDGAYTSESNARFDQMLKSRDADSGIRDYEWIEELAGKVRLDLFEDVEMPTNNRCLIWKKRT
jgi:SAM-dependent methyltransferase